MKKKLSMSEFLNNRKSSARHMSNNEKAEVNKKKIAKLKKQKAQINKEKIAKLNKFRQEEARKKKIAAERKRKLGSTLRGVAGSANSSKLSNEQKKEIDKFKNSSTVKKVKARDPYTPMSISDYMRKRNK